MKIGIITDTHFGVRNDNVFFVEHFRKFYSEIFFPTLEKYGVKTLLHLGDLNDRRKYINFNTAKALDDMFMKPLKEKNIEVHLIAGNHDTYYKNTNELNGISVLYGNDPNYNIYVNETKELVFDGIKFLMVPWITSENSKKFLEDISNSKADILLGHFDISGFEMIRGQLSTHGMDRTLFDKFEQVYSGHFHHPSKQGNIQYLGAPYEMVWSDWNCKRGFHIFDTETREAFFIENPHRMFHRLDYDDEGLTVENLEQLDFSGLTNTFVKVMIRSRTNMYLYELFLDRLQKHKVFDIKIFEESSYLSETTSIDDIVDEAADTETILKQYIDTLETNNKEKLKSLMSSLYFEAISLI